MNALLLILFLMEELFDKFESIKRIFFLTKIQFIFQLSLLLA